MWLILTLDRLINLDNVELVVLDQFRVKYLLASEYWTEEKFDTEEEAYNRFLFVSTLLNKKNKR